MNIAFQRRTDLALSALRALASEGGKLTGRRLAALVDTTTAFLPQVLAPLIRAGWITSERGPGGGYRITDSGRSVRLLDVIEATEGPSEDGRCALRDDECPGPETCPVHTVWVEARRVLMEGFADIAVIED